METTPPRVRSARTWIGAGIGAAAIAAAAVVGVHTLGSSTSTATAANTGAFGQPPGGMQQGRPPGPFGQITKISGDTITLSDAMRNSTVVVHTSGSTQVVGTTSSLSGLKVGDRIGVDGTTASDGSITATTIHVGDGPGGQGGPPQQ